MAAESPKGTYRVVGVRADKTRVDLGKGLTKESALAVVQTLADTNVFAEVLLEPDAPPADPAR